MYAYMQNESVKCVCSFFVLARALLWIFTANSGIRTIFIHYVEFCQLKPGKKRKSTHYCCFFRSILHGIPDLTIFEVFSCVLCIFIWLFFRFVCVCHVRVLFILNFFFLNKNAYQYVANGTFPCNVLQKTHCWMANNFYEFSVYYVVCTRCV